MTTPRTRTRKKVVGVEPVSETAAAEDAIAQEIAAVIPEPATKDPATAKKRRRSSEPAPAPEAPADLPTEWVNLELIPELTPEATRREWVLLQLITTDAGTQSRSTTSLATITDYAEVMKELRWEWERDPLPVLFWDGENYYPGDGHHRIEAAGTEVETIFCEVRPGTLRDAIFYSLSANRFHGLQRTNSDKRNQVEIALKDTEWQTMSDRAIAEHCGVSAPFVGKLRADLVEQGAVTVSSERTDKRGRKLKTDNIGTKAKPEKGRRADGSIDRRTSSARGGSGDQSVPEVHGNSSSEFVTFKPAASLKECLAALAAEYGGMEVLALAVLDQCSPTELKAVLEKAGG